MAMEQINEANFYVGIHTFIIKLYIILKPWDALYISQEDVPLYQAT